jgi:nucleoside 2-deoxyribosyltransferase
VYLIGSLRNDRIPAIGNALRDAGFEAFDDWYGAGHEADDKWRDYENLRGRDHKEALYGFAARHVFAFDKFHLDRCDYAVLVMPAGKSGHLELGYFVGRGKPGFILFDDVPERYDVMHNFATDVFYTQADLIEGLKNG